MNKKVILAGLAGIIILGGIIFLALKEESFSQKKEVASTEENFKNNMIFFYGKGCPHCENVEKFLEENKNIEEKVKFEKLEVWSSRKNKELMLEKAKICGIDNERLGVPLFWNGETCLSGDTPIIDFLKQKANDQ